MNAACMVVGNRAIGSYKIKLTTTLAKSIAKWKTTTTKICIKCSAQYNRNKAKPQEITPPLKHPPMQAMTTASQTHTACP